ncbi:MAG: fibronectin type III domain-containing protein [Terriglobales bacterium]
MRLARHPGRLCILAFAGLTACGVPGIPKPPSLNLPQPVTDLRAVRKGDRVYLAWTVPSKTTDLLVARQLGPTQVCRGTTSTMTECGTPVAEVAAPAVPTKNESDGKQRQSYADTLPAALTGPSAEVFYAVSVLNQDGRTAGISNVVEVPAVVAPAPPAEFQAQITADGVAMNWKETAVQGAQVFYRVYRRAEGSATDAVAGEAPAGRVQLVDHNFEWEKTYFYRATVVTVIHHEGKPDSEFEGADTPAIKVFAHDVFPPAVPSGVQAVFSGVGQQPFVDLIWAPDTDADLAGYNVYRREEGGEAQKINSGLVTTPAYRDLNVAAGHKYFYSVSAVDVRANESGRSMEASEAVP